MVITLQIVEAVIIEAIKSSTFLKGRLDEAAAQAGQHSPYYEIAGDYEVHERTLHHDFIMALEMVKTIFVDYIMPTAQTIGDNVLNYSSPTSDSSSFVANFTLNVSRRYNGTLTDTLARLTAKYVEDFMCYQWWTRLGNLNQAAPYQAALAPDELAIRRCFTYSAPPVPTIRYTSTLTARTDGYESAAGQVEIPKGEHCTLSYSIDNGSVDDIEARSADPSIVRVSRDCSTRAFCLHAVNTGFTDILLFSRHVDQASASVTVVVTEEEAYNQ